MAVAADNGLAESAAAASVRVTYYSGTDVSDAGFQQYLTDYQSAWIADDATEYAALCSEAYDTLR
jgi:hypothetical protein